MDKHDHMQESRSPWTGCTLSLVIIIGWALIETFFIKGGLT